MHIYARIQILSRKIRVARYDKTAECIFSPIATHRVGVRGWILACAGVTRRTLAPSCQTRLTGVVHFVLPKFMVIDLVLLLVGCAD